MIPPNMVRWPVHDPRYTSTGEGGLYAILAIPATAENEPSSAAGGCCVCTHTYLTRPDAPVSDNQAQVWDSQADGGTDHVATARRLLYDGGHEAASQNLGNVIGYDELSGPLRASVFLGSTSASLFNEATGQYYQVVPEDLDANGSALYRALKAAHQTEPLIVTLLDT